MRLIDLSDQQKETLREKIHSALDDKLDIFFASQHPITFPGELFLSSEDSNCLELEKFGEELTEILYSFLFSNSEIETQITTRFQKLKEKFLEKNGKELLEIDIAKVDKINVDDNLSLKDSDPKEDLEESDTQFHFQKQQIKVSEYLKQLSQQFERKEKTTELISNLNSCSGYIKFYQELFKSDKKINKPSEAIFAESEYKREKNYKIKQESDEKNQEIFDLQKWRKVKI